MPALQDNDKLRPYLVPHDRPLRKALVLVWQPVYPIRAEHEADQPKTWNHTGIITASEWKVVKIYENMNRLVYININICKRISAKLVNIIEIHITKLIMPYLEPNIIIYRLVFMA